MKKKDAARAKFAEEYKKFGVMADVDFYFLVKKMRSYQKAYFKTRDRRLMYRRIELEKQVDTAIKRYLEGKQ